MRAEAQRMGLPEDVDSPPDNAGPKGKSKGKVKTGKKRTIQIKADNCTDIVGDGKEIKHT